MLYGIGQGLAALCPVIRRPWGSMQPLRKRRLAIILSGGGARGAYEVGVLSYLFDELSRLRGAAPRVDIVCGTSVGGINGAYLAAHVGDPMLGVRRLSDVWGSLRIDAVLGFGFKQAVTLPKTLFGSKPAGGVFDVSPMAKLVEREIPWRAISRSLRRRQLQALSISTTEVATGRTVIFLQTGPDMSLPMRAPPRTLIRADHIGPAHALASAAIPLLFPPVPIGKHLYVDGGLRQNTPIAPAIRLGATHVLVVGTSRQVRGVVEPSEVPPALSMTFLLGKIMNALMLDHLDTDLGVVSLVNGMIESGEIAFGKDFVTGLNAAAIQRGAHAFRKIETLVVRPTVGIGRLAAEYLRSNRARSGTFLHRQFLKALDVGITEDADLASYLLFDGGFARILMELGRSDARARRNDLLDFLGRVEEDAPPTGSQAGGDASLWTLPPHAVG